MIVDTKARERAILDAAADLIIRYGYDKTTMGDVAEAVGLNRALLYAHFSSKDDLLEALIAREMQRYGEIWVEHIEADPKGGTVASMHRSVLYALQHSPFMSAIATRDEGTFGKYLRKPGNLFEGMQTPSLTRDLLEAMQAAGAVRQGVNLAAMAFVMDLISYGLVGVNWVPNLDPVPPYEELMETIAEMLDRMLTPEDGGNLEGGKAVIRQLADSARSYFAKQEQVRVQKVEAEK